MFTKLFASSGLSLDRLRSFLEVAAAGSISKAAAGDPVKQSQYSRQIKELEDFFSISLLERHGRGVRLTANGQELARIGRFFLLGLSNFQRGCHAEALTVRVCCPPTFASSILAPVLAKRLAANPNEVFHVTSAGEEEIAHRLHDLSADFGILTTYVVSRPLKATKLFDWRLHVWSPSAAKSRTERLPLTVALNELPAPFEADLEVELACADFATAMAALRSGAACAALPDYIRELPPKARRGNQVCGDYAFYLAWNPRSVRLNPALEKIKTLLERECHPAARP